MAILFAAVTKEAPAGCHCPTIDSVDASQPFKIGTLGATEGFDIGATFAARAESIIELSGMRMNITPFRVWQR